MNAPKVLFIVAIIVGALLFAELYNLELNSSSWGLSNRPGEISAEGPPEFVGVPAQSISSTLTHGAEIDRPKSLEALMEELARRDFATFLVQLEKKLPTLEDTAKLSAKEAHGSPRVLLVAAKELGVLAEKIEKTPSLRPDALNFYKGCALNKDVLTAIRAVCLSRADRLSNDLHGQHWNYDQRLVSKEVVELSKRL